MHASGQIVFPNPRKINRPFHQTKRALNHNHSPPLENQTASHFGSVLSFLLDKAQESQKGVRVKNTHIENEAVRDAKKEIVKESVVEKAQNTKKLEGLVQKSNKNLLTVSTVFPFTLFPNSVSIDPDKVVFDFMIFFFSHNYQTILIKEITNVEAQTDLFFGSLKITDSVTRGHTVRIKFLKKKDAQKARKIIEGLVVGVKQGIDFTQFTPEELVKKVEVLGESPSETQKSSQIAPAR